MKNRTRIPDLRPLATADVTGPFALFSIGIILFQISSPVRAELAVEAVDFSVAYTGEILSNRSGGLSRGSAYVDNLDLMLEIDAEALFGWRGTDVFLYGLYNNGTPFSETIVGDLQAVSNIETAVQALRLFEAWFRFPVGRQSDMLVGLYDLNSEFDVLGASQLFVESAHGIGTDISQAGLSGPSIFPISGLAMRLSKQFKDGWTARGAILDGAPGDPENPRKTRISLSSDEGALVIAEIERLTNNSRILTGGWAYSAKFIPDPLEIGSQDVPARRGNFGFYVRGEKTVYADSSALAVFGRLGYAHGDFNVFDYFASAGITWRGMFSGRHDDEMGIALAWANTSRKLMDTAEVLGRKVEPHEVSVELTYRAPINDILTIQPSFHYIANPGLDPSLDDAVVVGLRFELTLME